MARTPEMYRKLSGSGFSLALRHSLWQGPDHLLWVESGIFREQYKRFYFKDIQALTLHRTNRRILWTLVLGALLLLFGAVSLSSENAAYLFGGLSMLCTVLLAIQWLKGPGCELFLKTAVQTTKLSNLVRVPRAVKIMDGIKAAAEAAQGPLGRQGIADRQSFETRPATDSGRTFEARGGRLSSPAPGTGTGPYSSRMHRTLFGLLLAAGVLRGAQVWLKSIPLAAADILGLMCTLVLAIVVLARWHGMMKGTLLSMASWLSLILAAVHTMAAYGMLIAVSMRPRGQGVFLWPLLQKFFQLQTEGRPVVQAITVGIALASIGLGALGLIATLTFKGNRPYDNSRNRQRND